MLFFYHLLPSLSHFLSVALILFIYLAIYFSWQWEQLEVKNYAMYKFSP